VLSPGGDWSLPVSGQTRVGLLYSSSGATAIPESGLLEASLLAIDRCNVELGTGFEPLVADIRSDPATAAHAAHELRSQGAKVLIGCYTSACRKAVIPVLEESGVSLVYPTVYEGEEVHPRVFYFGAVPNQTVDPLLSWTVSHLSRDFVFVGSDYIYPRSVNRQARGFVEALGGRILHDEYFPLGCEDFTLFFQRSLRSRPSPAIFSTLVGKSIPAFYRQHREQGLRSTIVSPITSEVEFGCVGIDAAAGHYFADGHLESPDAPPRDGFSSQYQRRFGDRPVNGMMAAVYEAIMLLGRYFLNARTRGSAGDKALGNPVAQLRAPHHETPNGRIVLDPRSQHAWLWTRVARVGRRGKIETVWTSPGPTPPRPLGDRPWEAAPGTVRVPSVGVSDDDAFREVVGRSDALALCVRTARIAARTSAPVLLTGETGTGKELFARSIHLASDRKSGPFIAVNCAAMPAQLIESELFGYAPGAFTGARREGRKGKFELAAHGTLFLDEITEMPFEFQAVLLRALQEKAIVQVGGGREIEVDVRVIAATNRDIAPEREASSVLRSDLYFRLNVFRVDIPPLRRRPEDIPLFVEAALSRFNSRYGRCLSVTHDALVALMRYGWPGNVRELENLIERAFHLCTDGTEIDLHHLPAIVASASSDESSGTGASPSGILDAHAQATKAFLSPQVDAVVAQEKLAISRAIVTSGHNMSRASRILGISRSKLYRRLKSLSIAVPDQFAPR
jgi:DNA-binding NtrC family response regulator/ABC-type branched-subunit amino acid transport system substrate-binding protein